MVSKKNQPKIFLNCMFFGSTYIFFSKGDSFICFLSEFDRDLKLDEDAALEIQNQGVAQFFLGSGQLQ